MLWSRPAGGSDLRSVILYKRMTGGRKGKDAEGSDGKERKKLECNERRPSSKPQRMGQSGANNNAAALKHRRIPCVPLHRLLCSPVRRDQRAPVQPPKQELSFVASRSPRADRWDISRGKAS